MLLLYLPSRCLEICLHQLNHIKQCSERSQETFFLFFLLNPNLGENILWSLVLCKGPKSMQNSSVKEKKKKKGDREIYNTKYYISLYTLDAYTYTSNHMIISLFFCQGSRLTLSWLFYLFKCLNIWDYVSNWGFAIFLQRFVSWLLSVQYHWDNNYVIQL